MHIYLPADDRASRTVSLILEPFMASLSAAENIRDVTGAITNHLPVGFAHEAELRMMIDRTDTEFTARKFLVSDIVRNIIVTSVCRGFPVAICENGESRGYYMREDVVAWYESCPKNSNYFASPLEEIITVEISKDTVVNTSHLTLNKDQMIGISYSLRGLYNSGNYDIRIISSITDAPVSVSDISHHALSYRLPIALATEEIKRPYRVDILESSGVFITVHFTTPDFMQGVLSVARWSGFLKNGKNILWKNLCQFTRDGLIPLKF